MARARVFKRAGIWHWWCPCCLDGDNLHYATAAWRAVMRHIATEH